MSNTETAPPTRYYGFDYLRVFGILAVLYIHGCDTNEMARKGMKWLGFAVPCFFILSAFLTQLAILRKDIGYGELLANKFKRLAPAFFAWSSLYLLARFGKSSVTGAELDSGIFGIVFWGDASYQLYFVPMLFYSCVLWSSTMLLAKKHRTIAAVILSVAAALCIAFEATIDGLFPANRWFISKNIAWYPIGILIALLADWMGSRRSAFFWPSLLLLGAMLCTGFVNVYALSVTVFVFATSITRPAPSWLGKLATISFGVYLSHVLFLETLQFTATRLKLDVSSLSVTLSITCLTAVLSFVICFALAKPTQTRWSVT